jgi:bifunctional non-homologous end joining protein LigD
MLATLVGEPFDDRRWVFETKWDGFRLITEKRGHAVKLWSRNGIDVTTRYAVLLPALQKIDGSCAIDGELCALDAYGRSRFQLLQNALNKKARLLYVVFDALFVGGKDIREKPLLERKKILKGLMPRDPALQRARRRVWYAGVRHSTTSARGRCDRQACGGTLLLR